MGEGNKIDAQDEFLHFLCARACAQCRAGKSVLVNSEGFYSHAEEGNHCVAHWLYKAHEDWMAKSEAKRG